MQENFNLNNISPQEIKEAIDQPFVDMHLDDVIIVKDQGEDHGNIPSRH